jgi:hypothetical protein
MISPFTLSEAIAAIGVAEVFIGDPMTDDGMISLGATEGTIEFTPTQAMNPLTAPELTGNVPHQAVATLDQVMIKCSVILGDPDLYAKISPWGAKGGGHSNPQKVAETSVLLIPRGEVGGGLDWDAGAGTPQWVRTAGNGVAAATGAQAAPVNAVWLWRAYPMFEALPFQYGNGGKILVPVTFTAMFDATKPEGHKVYTIGDPRALTPTPVNVDL